MEKKHFKIEILEQKIIIMIDSNKYIDKEINIFIKDIENESELNRGIVSLNKDIIYWFTPFNMESYHGFIIDIFYNNTLIFNETIRTKGTGGDRIKKQCLFISDLDGMGDAFFCRTFNKKNK